MTEGSEIERLLDTLESLIEEAEGRGKNWRDVWVEIKNIGRAFKDSRFPTAQDRQLAWNRFQSLVARVKARQEQAKRAVEGRIQESERHLDRILSYASSATPSSELADVLFAVVTGGLSVVVQAGLEAILGPFDERKLELQKCSQALKQGWAYLSQNKGDMLGKHKKEAFEALSKASDSLGAAWDTWKTGRQRAVEHYRSQKQAAREARQAKREAWETRMRENISKLEDRLSRLESALERRRGNLSRLEDMRSSARSDAYRERVENWISEEREKIDQIRDKIGRTEEWLSETKSKLG